MLIGLYLIVKSCDYFTATYKMSIVENIFIVYICIAIFLIHLNFPIERLVFILIYALSLLPLNISELINNHDTLDIYYNNVLGVICPNLVPPL